MPRVGIVLLALSAVFFGINFGHEWWLSHQIEAQAAGLRQQIAQAEAQNTQLQQQITYYGSKQYIILKARSQLGMVRPGDTLMHVQQLPPRVKIVRIHAQPAAPHESLFIHLLRAIFQ
jgi:cell division protein FtsB